MLGILLNIICEKFSGLIRISILLQDFKSLLILVLARGITLRRCDHLECKAKHSQGQEMSFTTSYPPLIGYRYINFPNSILYSNTAIKVAK